MPLWMQAAAFNTPEFLWRATLHGVDELEEAKWRSHPNFSASCYIDLSFLGHEPVAKILGCGEAEGRSPWAVEQRVRMLGRARTFSPKLGLVLDPTSPRAKCNHLDTLIFSLSDLTSLLRAISPLVRHRSKPTDDAQRAVPLHSPSVDLCSDRAIEIQSNEPVTVA